MTAVRPPLLRFPPAPTRAGLHCEQLVEIAKAVAAAEPSWRPLVRHDSAARWYVRLWATARVESWLLGWTRGQAIELHDHGGSSGAVYVVDGSLTEDYTDVAAPAPLRRVQWRSGSVHSFGPGHIHDLRNFSEEAATSIHVYSPPLSSMTYYRREIAGGLTPARVEPCATARSHAVGEMG